MHLSHEKGKFGGLRFSRGSDRRIGGAKPGRCHLRASWPPRGLNTAESCVQDVKPGANEGSQACRQWRQDRAKERRGRYNQPS